MTEDFAPWAVASGEDFEATHLHHAVHIYWTESNAFGVGRESFRDLGREDVLPFLQSDCTILMTIQIRLILETRVSWRQGVSATLPCFRDDL